ncbi:MAG: menaquinone biosynthesis decarboxylase [Chitinophagales bacterium]|nr:menaquinone biosynthesis decarboxylase [Chitinophagales bacterium]
MAYKSLQHFVGVLEKEGELIRIKEFVNPQLEITEIVDRISKNNGPALFFENTGTEFPLLINAFGSRKRICLALGVNDLDDVSKEIEALFKSLMKPKDNILEKLMMLPKLNQLASWMPKVKSGRGECQQVIMENPDITKLPVMKCWPEDGGDFLTLPVINTKDPNTGIRNVGMYRMQVFAPDLTGMHWHKHKVSAKHFAEYKKLKKRMPVSVVLGGDPVYTYAATAPLPENVDEYMLAGFLRKKKVDLVKCITNEMEVPADADFVIEGYVDPEEENILEGPFGDHTGYYSLADFYPKFHITCITHKRNAIYPSTIVGIPPQEDAWLGKATERIFLAPIKMTMIPEIVDMELPIEGVFHNLTIIKIKKEYPGHAQKVTNAMWGAGQMMFNKILVVVDESVDIHNYAEVANAISINVDPQQDIFFSQGPMDVLDHSCSKFAFGGKMCVDATVKLEEELRGIQRVVGAELSVASEKNFQLTNNLQPTTNNRQLTTDNQQLTTDYPEIKSINTSLLEKGISVVFISIEKNRRNHIRELNEKLFRDSELKKVKVIIYVEHTVDANDIKDVVWRWSNNVDPRRDSYVVKAESDAEISHIGFDGTRKTKELDNFDRDWPNIICMDEETISAVDEKWNRLGLGKFISSPSLKYRKQLYKGGAVITE